MSVAHFPGATALCALCNAGPGCFGRTNPPPFASSRDLAERTHRHSGAQRIWQNEPTLQILAEQTQLQVLEMATDTENELVVAWIDLDLRRNCLRLR